MGRRSQAEDQALVRECLAGSERAWKEFHGQFIGLMRTVCRKYGSLSSQDVEDVTQSAFLSLTTALKTYDFQQSLPRFVCLVTQRVLIDEYRKTKAAKRDRDRELAVGSEAGEINPGSMLPESSMPDARLEKAELVQEVRVAIRSLDPRCRQLITMRYLNDLSFKEIADALNVNENTVTVQTRRCLDTLRTRLRERKRRGTVS
jgi:RNA polymerase sigma-70 factor (ECF subfamily)